MDDASRLRLRSTLSTWLPVLLVVAVAVAGVGGWATYTAHAAPGTTTEQRTTTAWTAAAGFDHSATVTRENPLYPVGTELTNRSTYFRSAAPVVDGRFTVRQRGLTGNVSVDLATALVLESADEETTYWTDRRRLAATTASNVGADPVAVGFSLNVSEVADRIADIEGSLGSTPGETSAAVVVDVEVAGTVDGERSRLSFTRRLPVGLSGDTYTVSAPGPTEEPATRTTAVEVPREYGPLRSLGGPLALLVGAVAAGGLAYGSRTETLDLSERERARLEYLDDRAEYDEWIVSARLPSTTAGDRVAEASSLADLVDLAIDSDAAVVEDSADGTFHVHAGEYRFTYRPPTVDGSEPPASDRTDAVAAGSEAAPHASPADPTPRGTDSGSSPAPEASDGADAPASEGPTAGTDTQ